MTSGSRVGGDSGGVARAAPRPDRTPPAALLLQGWRNAVLDRLSLVVFFMALGLLAVFALPGAGLATPLIPVYAVLVIVVGIAAFVRRLGFVRRAVLMLGSWWVVGVTSVLNQGFIGTPHVVLLVTVAITGVLFGARATVLSLVAALLTMVAGALLHTLGALPQPSAALIDLHDGVTWTIVIIGYGTFGAMLVFAQRTIIAKLEATLIETEQLVEGLDHEIAERTVAYQKLERAQEQVVQLQRTEAISRVASGVAHDFNNTLMAILNEATLVDEALGDEARSDATRAGMRSIIAATERAAKLTRQLLMLSRRDVQKPRVIDLAEAVRSASWIRSLVPTSIALEIDATDVTPVRIDETHLHQILLNLVVNARDAMPDGGRLRIAAGVERVAEAGVTTSQGSVLPAGRWAKLVVTDTGGGIGDDVLPHVFEPFFTTKPIGRGTGLGLATVQTVVDGAGGGISVKSRPGHGTTFEVMLPISTDPVAASPHPTADARVGPLKLLIAEDDALVRSSMTRILVRAGHDVIAARDAVDAIAQLELHGESIDHVITDGVMPGGGAGAVIAYLRSRQLDVHVTVLSGYLDIRDVAHKLVTDEVDVLTKPVSAEVLLACLKRKGVRGG